MNDKSNAVPRISLSIAIEFDQRVFKSIVARFGVKTWNHFIGRLLDSDLTAAVWPSGTPPPSVMIYFKFSEEEGLKERWPEADFSAIYFVPAEGKAMDTDEVEELPDHMELYSIPMEEIPLTADVTCLIDRT